MTMSIRAAVALVGLALGGLALAQASDRRLTQEQEKKMLRIQEDLRSEAKLPARQVSALDEDIRAYVRRGGGDAQMREVIREAVRNDCKGQCIHEVVGGMKQAVGAGLNDREARHAMVQTIKAEKLEQKQSKAKLTEAEYGERIRTAMDVRVAQMTAEKERARGRHEKMPAR